VSFAAGPNGVVSGRTTQTVFAEDATAPVVALPNTGHQFVQWTATGIPFSLDNPLTVTGVVEDLHLVAEFAVTQYTVSVMSGAGGSLAGELSQVIPHGGATSPVTALPDHGQHFVGWTLGGLGFSTQNPLRVSAVTSDLELTAQFAANTYTVRFVAAANGGLAGAVVQTVVHGGTTTLVAAVPNTGHRFVHWQSEGTPYSSDSTIALTEVDRDVTVTAVFAVCTYSVTFLADSNGTLAGTPAQTVQHGVNASPVVAVANTGYQFLHWLLDGTLFSTENPLTLKNVTADTILTAAFAVTTYTVTFAPGPHGGLAGVPSQRVSHGAATSAVSAVPNTGYHFVRWSLAGTFYSASPALLLLAVTSDLSLTAEFEINQYSVTFAAGPNGSLIGTPIQTLAHGASTLPVTAVPAFGYHFLRWSLAGNHFSTGNPLTVATVVSDLTLTAEFALSVYPVTFTPGANGSVAGATAQMIAHGSGAAAATAVPAPGFHFRRWTLAGEEYSRDNPLNLTNVTAAMALLAEFEINTYSVTFTAGADGSIAQNAVQTVSHGADSTAVLAVPAVGYHFLRWTRDNSLFSTRNPLTVEAVTHDLVLTAEFAVSIYTVRFLAGANGHLSGATVQQIPHGGTAAPVQAVADLGYMFALWDDGFGLNPRSVANVTADATFTAQFRNANAVVPAGAFLARVGLPRVAAGWGLWDISGHYETQVSGAPLTLDLMHDAKGKIRGTGTIRITAHTGTPVAVPLAVKGSARGSGGAVTVTLTATGSQAGTAAEPGLNAKVALTLNLTLDIHNRRLLGAATLNQKTGRVSALIPAYCELALPAGMDGTYSVLLQLVLAGTRLTGTAVLTLSNGADYLFAVKGTFPGDACLLTLAGHKTDPPAKSIKMGLALRTLEGSAAQIDRLDLTGYGQTLAK
jgi:hypothetical protein